MYQTTRERQCISHIRNRTHIISNQGDNVKWEVVCFILLVVIFLAWDVYVGMIRMGAATAALGQKGYTLFDFRLFIFFNL